MGVIGAGHPKYVTSKPKYRVWLRGVIAPFAHQLVNGQRGPAHPGWCLKRSTLRGGTISCVRAIMALVQGFPSSASLTGLTELGNYWHHFSLPTRLADLGFWAGHGPGIWESPGKTREMATLLWFNKPVIYFSASIQYVNSN